MYLRLKQGDEFRSLEKQWYDRLKQGGFEDIEDTRSSRRYLKEWDFNFFRMSFNEITYQATIEYYSQAKKILKEYPFKRKIDRTIWNLHTQGVSCRKIAGEIKVLRKSMVHLIIFEIAQLIKNEK